MRRVVAAAGLAFLASACTPQVKNDPVVVARFDPGAATPVVPTPTDLIEDKQTGMLKVPLAADASEADKAFVNFLNNLGGYPTVASGTTTFTGELDPASVDADSILVLDITDRANPVRVDGVSYQVIAQPNDEIAKTKLLVRGPKSGTWLQGHRYAIALRGGEKGLKGKNGEPVEGTAAWFLLRSPKPLVLCEDGEFTNTRDDCRPATDLIPSKISANPETMEARIKDQTATAIRLEEVRLHYAPTVEAFLKEFQAEGLKREEIELMWSFRIHEQPMVVFAPSATPARVPSPTDLAYDPVAKRLAIPENPKASPAEREFFQEYMNTLDGWPSSSTATVEIDGGKLDPATVTPDAVRLYDLTAEAAGGPAQVDLQPVYDAVRNRITYAPPAGGWKKGHTYAVAVIADAQRGLRMEDGRFPIGSEVWDLLRLKAPLASCTPADSKDPANCVSNLKVAGASAADALRLEGIRRDYAPLFEKLERQGIPRSSVAVAWKFTVGTFPEATFDPGNKVIPFPNDLVRVNGKLALPIAENASDSAKQLLQGLNELDGWSLTAVAVSENSMAKGVLDNGILPESELANGVGFLAVTDAPAPQVDICLDCATIHPEGGASTAPQQLQFVPKVPLAEGHTYGGYIKAGIKDAEGRAVIPAPAFVLMRSAHELAKDGKSLVSVLSDEQAVALEAARQTLKPLMDKLESQGLKRKDVALAFNFTTQTTRATAHQVAAVPYRQDTKVTVSPLNDGLNTVLSSRSPANQNPFPSSNVGTFYISRLTLPDVLTGAGGTLNVESAGAKEVPFLLTLPVKAPASPNGYPVVVFGHPITSTRMAALGLADKLAANGFATLVVDQPLHGERSTCVGSKDSLALSGQDLNRDTQRNDNDACVDGATCNASTGRCERPAGVGTICNGPSVTDPITGQPTPTGDALCFIRKEGLCSATTGRCEGGFRENSATSAPFISGWNFIGSNFHANRANLLQSVADAAQLVRIIQATGAETLNDRLARANKGKLDASAIHYVGMSLGGITGTVASSAVPAIKRVVINAAGSDLPGILVDGLTPEARKSFLDKVKMADPNLVPGNPAFDQFINVLRIAMDGGDSAVHAPGMLSPEAGLSRGVFFQYVQGDSVIPNAYTQKLIDGSVRNGMSALVSEYIVTDNITAADRHGFLVTGAYNTPRSQGLKAAGTQAQNDVVKFLTTGSIQ